jgi:hypothetical protein
VQLQTSLPDIGQLATDKEEENNQFVTFLKQQDATVIDEKVHSLNKLIEPEIDCTACGNCCKSLLINVTEEEADRVAGRLHMARNKFDEQYIEKGSHGLLVMNTIPCHFLTGNKCTVYEDRFAGCREFPALHLPSFTKRLFTVMMHYNRCPIIFNVVEKLKTETGFCQ